VRCHHEAGGGLAGAGTAVALREQGYGGSIVVFAAENHVPYDRPPLSKAYLKGETVASEGEIKPADWYAAHDVDLRLGTAVTAVEREAHQVVSTDGGRTAYDRLVLATGSSPRRVDLPGHDLGGVLSLRTVEDSDALRAAFGAGARIVIIGAGWIGLEVAAAARAAGCTVTTASTCVWECRSPRSRRLRAVARSAPSPSTTGRSSRPTSSSSRSARRPTPTSR